MSGWLLAPLATVYFWYIVWFHVAVVLFCVIGIVTSWEELRESKRRARERQALLAWADEAEARKARTRQMLEAKWAAQREKEKP